MSIDVRHAELSDGDTLARLRWAWRVERKPETETKFGEAEFLAGFQSWWVDNHDRHVAVVATYRADVVGMGFLSVVGRVPNPGDLQRRHGDLQSVYVAPEHRGQGVGTRVVLELVERAQDLGCDKVTVHAGQTSVPLYERLGFARFERLLTLDLAPPARSTTA
jgi:GNAT superfamily N-acetyltransferase